MRRLLSIVMLLREPSVPMPPSWELRFGMAERSLRLLFLSGTDGATSQATSTPDAPECELDVHDEPDVREEPPLRVGEEVEPRVVDSWNSDATASGGRAIELRSFATTADVGCEAAKVSRWRVALANLCTGNSRGLELRRKACGVIRSTSKSASSGEGGAGGEGIGI